jgi:hypothetical protein
MVCVAGGKVPKKVEPMIAASEPYRKKSYHSKTVRRDEAKMTLRSSSVTPTGSRSGVAVETMGVSLDLLYQSIEARL